VFRSARRRRGPLGPNHPSFGKESWHAASGLGPTWQFDYRSQLVNMTGIVIGPVADFPSGSILSGAASMATESSISLRLNSLQFADSAPVVLVEQIPVGYGGQMSLRVLGLKIGAALGRKAIFLSDADPLTFKASFAPTLWTRRFSQPRTCRTLTFSWMTSVLS
jgi:hypothetical protein